MIIEYHTELKIAVNTENGEEAHNVKDLAEAAVIWGSADSDVIEVK